MQEIETLDLEFQTFQKLLKDQTKNCHCGKKYEKGFIEDLKKENDYLREENLDIFKNLTEKSEEIKNCIFSVKDNFLKISDFGEFKNSYISIINDLNRKLKNEEKENHVLKKKIYF